MLARDILASGLLLSGSGLALSAAIGLHRLPDVYARMHAAAKPATLGVALCLMGAALRAPSVEVAAKLGLALVLQLIAAPVAGHLIGRAAYATGAELSPHTVIDDLDTDRLRTAHRTGTDGPDGL